MSRKPKVALEYKVLSEAGIDPDSGAKNRTIKISKKKLRALYELKGADVSEQLTYMVPDAVEKPKHVYEGLREGLEQCVCYVGQLDYNHRDGNMVAPPPGKVFCVFVGEQGELLNYYWHTCDPDNPDLPADHRERFGRKRF